MSSSNCCFLTCIQVAQEAGKVVWYFQFFQNFPQFVVIHTVKGFTIVNEEEVDVFLEFSCFFLWSNRCWQFACISGSSWFTYCWRLAWRILSITLLACEMSTVVWQFEHSLTLPFFRIGMKTDLIHVLYKQWNWVEGNVKAVCWFRKEEHYLVVQESPPCLEILIYIDRKWKLLSPLWLLVTPWTIQSREFSRLEYWSG